MDEKLVIETESLILRTFKEDSIVECLNLRRFENGYFKDNIKSFKMHGYGKIRR